MNFVFPMEQNTRMTPMTDVSLLYIYMIHSCQIKVLYGISESWQILCEIYLAHHFDNRQNMPYEQSLLFYGKIKAGIIISTTEVLLSFTVRWLYICPTHNHITSPIRLDGYYLFCNKMAQKRANVKQ